MKEYNSKNPHPTDKIVGYNIRRLRNLRGFSQEHLGIDLGITFQQVQKYENATNRVSASKLEHIARILGVNILDFYHGINNNTSEYSFLDDDVLKLAGKIQKLPEPIRTRQVMLFDEIIKSTKKGM